MVDYQTPGDCLTGVAEPGELCYGRLSDTRRLSYRSSRARELCFGTFILDSLGCDTLGSQIFEYLANSKPKSKIF